MLATAFDRAWLRPANVADEPSLPPTIGDAFDVAHDRPLAPPDVDALIRVGAVGATSDLIDDGTLWVIRHGTRLVGYAAWTFRSTTLRGSPGAAPPIRRPGADPALAFGVHPVDGPHQAAGRALLARLETDMRNAGYESAELVVAPASAPFHLAAGYRVLREVEILLPAATRLRALRLHRRFDAPRLAIV